MTWAMVRTFGPLVAFAVLVAACFGLWQHGRIVAGERDRAQLETKAETTRADQNLAVAKGLVDQMGLDRQASEDLGRKLDAIDAQGRATRSALNDLRRTGDAPTREWIDAPVPDAVRRVLGDPALAAPGVRPGATAGGPDAAGRH